MKKVPVALQLWSVREDAKRDFAATAAAVAEIGYAGVELAGYGNLDAKGAKDALDAAGLKVASMHVGYQALRNDPGTVISDALLFGTHFVRKEEVASDDHDRSVVDVVQQVNERLNGSAVLVGGGREREVAHYVDVVPIGNGQRQAIGRAHGV